MASKTPATNYYQLLGLKRSASKEDIRRAYRNLSKRYHPDVHGGSARYENKFKAINEAYATLSNPERRRSYDRRFWASPERERPRRPQQKRRTQAQQRSRRSSNPRQGGLREEIDPLLRGFTGFSLLVLVFILPLMMAGGPSAAQSTPRPVAEKVDQGFDLDRQFRYETRLIRRITKVDPKLQGLDRETGHYRLNGKDVYLSREALNFIEENGIGNQPVTAAAFR